MGSQRVRHDFVTNPPPHFLDTDYGLLPASGFGNTKSETKSYPWRILWFEGRERIMPRCGQHGAECAVNSGLERKLGQKSNTWFKEQEQAFQNTAQNERKTLPHLTTCCAFCPWISSVQSLSRVRLFATSWTAACQASLSINMCVCIYIYVFLPGEFYGQKSLADYSPWGHKQWDMTEQVTHHVKGTFKGESGNRNTSALNGKVPFSSSCHSTLHSQWKISGHAKPRQC